MPRRKPGDGAHDAGLRVTVTPSIERDLEAGAAVTASVDAEEELTFGELSLSGWRKSRDDDRNRRRLSPQCRAAQTPSMLRRPPAAAIRYHHL